MSPRIGDLEMGKKNEKNRMPNEEKEEGASGYEMPTGGMQGTSSGGGMPTGGMEEKASSEGGPPVNGGTTMPGNEMPGGTMEGGLRSVLVELRLPASQAASDAIGMAEGLNVPGLEIDPSYEPVPIKGPSDESADADATSEQTVIVRGMIEESKIPELEAQAEVVKVWKDTPIQPFGAMVLEEEKELFVLPMEGFAACPIGTCD